MLCVYLSPGSSQIGGYFLFIHTGHESLSIAVIDQVMYDPFLWETANCDVTVKCLVM